MSRTWHKKKASHYQGSRKWDPVCRCHGGCSWCLGNRMHKHRKQRGDTKVRPSNAHKHWGWDE